MKKLILGLSFFTTILSGCNNSLTDRYNVKVTFEENGQLVKDVSGTIKVKNTHGIFLIPVTSGVLNKGDLDDFLNTNEFDEKNLTVSFRRRDQFGADLATIICPQGLKYSSKESTEYPDWPAIDHVKDHYINLHFNLNTSCADPFAQTQKLLRKEFLRRLFMQNDQQRNSVKELEQDADRKKQSQSVAI